MRVKLLILPLLFLYPNQSVGQDGMPVVFEDALNTEATPDLGFWTPSGEYLGLKMNGDTTFTGLYKRFASGSTDSEGTVKGTLNGDTLEIRVSLDAQEYFATFAKRRNIDGNPFWAQVVSQQTCADCPSPLTNGLFGVTNRRDPEADAALAFWNGNPRTALALQDYTLLIDRFPELGGEWQKNIALLVPRSTAPIAEAYSRSFGDTPQNEASIRTLGDSYFGDSALVKIDWSDEGPEGSKDVAGGIAKQIGKISDLRIALLGSFPSIQSIDVKSVTVWDRFVDSAHARDRVIVELSNLLSDLAPSRICSVSIAAKEPRDSGEVACLYHASEIGLQGDFWMMTIFKIVVSRSSRDGYMKVTFGVNSQYDAGKISTKEADLSFQPISDEEQRRAEAIAVNSFVRLVSN